MTAQTLDPGHDPNKDEMCFRYPFTGQANSEVRVCRSAIVQGEAWVKARIEGYFKYHEKPQPGTTMRIEDYQFNPSLFQPEQWG